MHLRTGSSFRLSAGVVSRLVVRILERLPDLWMRFARRDRLAKLLGAIREVHPRLGQIQQPQLIARSSRTLGEPQGIECVVAIVFLPGQGADPMLLRGQNAAEQSAFPGVEAIAKV
jgi:hypothetical protein